ncbi:unnamed protein product [Debaryomyces fabryi]|nr:unnamed protein product [Debaryomyces fabryi]
MCQFEYFQCMQIGLFFTRNAYFDINAKRYHSVLRLCEDCKIQQNEEFPENILFSLEYKKTEV